MARSPVRSGLFDARDRATKKRRDRNDPKEPDAPTNATLLAWIEERLERQSPDELERIDLAEYIRQTHEFDIPVPERLRLLATQLETLVRSFDNPLRAWAALDRVYQYAERLSPQGARVRASRGISASELAEEATCRDDRVAATRLYGFAHAALAKAAELSPTDAEIAYLQGYVHYMDDASGPSRALEHFDSPGTASIGFRVARVGRRRGGQ